MFPHSVARGKRADDATAFFPLKLRLDRTGGTEARSTCEHQPSTERVCVRTAVPATLSALISPPFRRRPGHVELSGRGDERPAMVNNQARNAKTMLRSQSSINVGHEDLQVRDVFALDSSHSTTGDPRSHPTTTASRHIHSTNLPGQYS